MVDMRLTDNRNVFSLVLLQHRDARRYVRCDFAHLEHVYSVVLPNSGFDDGYGSSDGCAEARLFQRLL